MPKIRHLIYLRTILENRDSNNSFSVQHFSEKRIIYKCFETAFFTEIKLFENIFKILFLHDYS